MYKIWCWSFFMLSSTLVQIWIKYYINFLCIICSLQHKRLKKLPNLFPNPYRSLYLLFKKIYDEFDVYLLWIFTSWMLKTRIQICIIDSISYLFAIKEKRLKNWLSNKYRFRPFSSLYRTKIGQGTLASTNRLLLRGFSCEFFGLLNQIVLYASANIHTSIHLN
jgi:hypothetical protein